MNSSLRYGGIIALFSSFQMGLGVYRGVHDPQNTVAASALTGMLTGGFQQRSMIFRVLYCSDRVTGGRGIMWGLLYGLGLGAVISSAELLLRMINTEESTLPVKEDFRPKDYSTVVRLDMETELEMDRKSSKDDKNDL